MGNDTGLDSAESWENAKNYALLLGAVPSSFATAIRALIQDDERNKGVMSDASRFNVTRLVKGPSMKAAIYFASLDLRGSAISDGRHLTAADLVALYKPTELAALVGAVYLYRRAKKVTPPEEFQILMAPVQQAANTGFFVGSALPAIGAGVGLLVGMLRSIAFACFLKHDLKGAKAYMRQLKISKLSFDQDFEAQRWGCSSAQIASVHVQSLGLGIPFASGLAGAMSGPPSKIEGLEGQMYRLRLARLWIETLLATGKEPQIVHQGQYYPVKTALQELIENVATVKSGAGNNWLEKNKDDITPQATPQLFKEAQPEPPDADGAETAEEEIG